MSIPFVMNMMISKQDPYVEIIGFISNREFVFYTEEDKKKWHMEISLDVFKSMDTMQKGDPWLLPVSGKYRGEIDGKDLIDGEIGQYIVVKVGKEICKCNFDPKEFNSKELKPSESPESDQSQPL